MKGTLTSTKRLILQTVSVTLAVICLSTGLFLKYGDFEEPVILTDSGFDTSLEVSTVSLDSIGWYADAPMLNNPDD